jgi:hypothetical protein
MTFITPASAIQAATLCAAAEWFFKKKLVTSCSWNGGRIVHLWIDFPQTVVAGLIAWNCLRNSRFRYVLCGYLVVSSLLFKVSLTPRRKSPMERMDYMSNHILRLSVKWTNFAAALGYAVFVDVNKLVAYSSSLFLLHEAVVDSADTYRYSQSTSRSLHEWHVLEARRTN